MSLLTPIFWISRSATKDSLECARSHGRVSARACYCERIYILNKGIQSTVCDPLSLQCCTLDIYLSIIIYYYRNSCPLFSYKRESGSRLNPGLHRHLSPRVSIYQAIYISTLSYLSFYRLFNSTQIV